MLARVFSRLAPTLVIAKSSDRFMGLSGSRSVVGFTTLN